MGVDTLQQQLSKYKLVFLDTMVFVYLLEQHPVYRELAESVLALVEAGKLEAVTSVLTLAEVLTGPAQAQNSQALQDYKLYLTYFPHLQIISVEPEHATGIAQVRATFKLRTPDAVQIAVASVAGVDAIIGNDKAWLGKTGAVDYLLLDSFR